MPQRDNVSKTQMVFLGTVTLSGTTPAASDWVDTRGFDSCALAMKTNTVTDAGTASGFSFEMQESDTTAASDASAVADAEILGSESDLTVTNDGTDDTLVGILGYVGDARYVRLEGTGTTGTDAGVDVYAIVQHAHREPATDVGASVAAT